MFRHILPNAMVATLTMLPFRDRHDLGPGGAGLSGLRPADLGALAWASWPCRRKQNLQAPWLAFTAFFTFAIMLSLLVFIFEGIRDAFDPRKTFK
jgi:microcin C transport system permease protein